MDAAVSKIKDANVDTDISRRRFFATSVATSGSIATSPSEGWTRAPLQPDQAQVRLVEELMGRLGMSKSNAEAMAMRATRSIERPGAILLGNASGAEVEVVEWERRKRKWMLRGEPGCDVTLANAVGLATTGAAALIAGQSVSLRWLSSCHFGGTVGHVLRHARGHVFLVTGGDSQSCVLRVDFG